MDVMTIKYSSSKTKDVAEKAIGLHCNTIRSKQSFDLSLLRKLCGTVIYSGRKGSYGNLLVIDHGNGVETWYAHTSKMYVKSFILAGC